MIELRVRYQVAPGTAEEFVRAVCQAGIPEESRAEEGCLLYEFQPIEPGRDEVILLEKWRDKASQKNHFATAHYEELSEIKAQYVDDVHIDRTETE